MNSNELIKILEAKLQASPKDYQTKEKLAELLLKQAKYTKAEALFSELLHYDPHHKTALWGLAKINWVKKDFEAAYKYCTQLATNIDYKLTKEQALTFAKVCVQLKEYEQAQKWFDYAVSLDSSLLQTEIALLRFLRTYNEQKAQRDQHEQMQDDDEPGSSPSNYIVIEIGKQILSPASGMPNPFTEPQNLNGIIENSVPAETVMPVVTFDQIGGMQDIKRKVIRELLLPLSNSEINVESKKSSNPKVLLYGAPGCGKTHLCHAIHNESEITFFNLSPGDFIDLSYEEAEARLELLLAQARFHKPAVLLLDDVTWIASDPESELADADSYLYRKNLFERILKLLDEKFKFNSHIGLLAITNNPWNLSSDFFGANRISQTVYLPPPNFNEKIEILKQILQAKTSAILNFEDINALQVMRALDNILLCGADIEQLIETAISDVMLEKMIMPDVKDDLRISTKSLIAAGKKLRNLSNIKGWQKKAKAMKNKNHPLHHLWETMEDTIKNRHE